MITWSFREPPLPAVAVAGTSALYAATQASLARGVSLRAAVGDDWILVLGDDLPWAADVTYLGWDGGVLVPTTLRPSVPGGVLRAALGSEVLAVLPGRILSGAMPVRKAVLP
ncbi:hypothetical protein [Actinocrispum sp. NPDC049592]|uniref:hypothetical protein n=1 Tax=Actinocrispum sp. NPDC049592 TaxID=3154835 RepID=UPI00341A47F3